MEKRLYRSKTDRMLFGVCGGLGEYFDIDPVVMRLLFVAFAFAGGIGFIVYIIAAVIIPEANSSKPGENKTKPANIEKTAKEFVRELETRKYSSGGLILGLILLLLGIIFLLQNLFDWFSFDNFWPLILIVLGLAILIKQNKKE